MRASVRLEWLHVNNICDNPYVSLKSLQHMLRTESVESKKQMQQTLTALDRMQRTLYFHFSPESSFLLPFASSEWKGCEARTASPCRAFRNL